MAEMGLAGGVAGDLLKGLQFTQWGVKSGKDLASKEGVRKTINHFKSGEDLAGLQSLAGDVFDASFVATPITGLFNDSKMIAKALKNAKFRGKVRSAMDSFNNVPKAITYKNYD